MFDGPRWDGALQTGESLIADTSGTRRAKQAEWLNLRFRGAPTDSGLVSSSHPDSSLTVFNMHLDRHTVQSSGSYEWKTTPRFSPAATPRSSAASLLSRFRPFSHTVPRVS